MLKIVALFSGKRNILLTTIFKNRYIVNNNSYYQKYDGIFVKNWIKHVNNNRRFDVVLSSY